MKGTKQMIKFLLLAVHAVPFHTPYKDATACADYDKDINRLAVGTTDAYVANVIREWNTNKCPDIRLEGHNITGWRVADSGIYLTHTTADGRSWNTYLPDIADPNKVTADRLNSLVDMYNDISASPGMRTKDIADFIVSKSVNDFLKIKNPTPEQIIDILPKLSQTMYAIDAASNTADFVMGPLWEKCREKWRQLRKDLPNFLTGSVLSNPSLPSLAAKGFIELRLRLSLSPNPSYVSYVKLSKELSELLPKLGTVSSLTLGGINVASFNELLEDPAFVELLTSPATLATITADTIFGEIMKVCIDKRDELSANLSLDKYKEYTEYMEQQPNFARVVTAAQNQNNTKKIEQVLKDISQDFLSKYKELRAIKDDAEGEKFVRHENNAVFIKTLEKIMDAIAQEPFSLDFLRKMQQEDLQNTDDWKALYDIFSSQEIVEKIQERELYTKGIIHIIDEMKRRSEDAKSRAQKRNMHETAARIWKNNEVIIRMISPKAAAKLKEMAEYVR